MAITYHIFTLFWVPNPRSFTDLRPPEMAQNVVTFKVNLYPNLGTLAPGPMFCIYLRRRFYTLCTPSLAYMSANWCTPIYVPIMYLYIHPVPYSLYTGQAPFLPTFWTYFTILPAVPTHQAHPGPLLPHLDTLPKIPLATLAHGPDRYFSYFDPCQPIPPK